LRRRCLGGLAARHGFLQQMLAFSSHPQLPLAALTLPFWAHALRASVAAAAFAASPAAASTSGGDGGGGDGSAAPLTVPPECAIALVGALAAQLPAVAAHASEPPPGGGAPSWPPAFDSALEWKEFCNNFRGASKNVVKTCAALAPAQVAGALASALPAALAAAADAGAPPARRHIALEALALLLEGALPGLCEAAAAALAAGGAAAASVPPLLDGLASLLQQLLAARLGGDAAVAALHARCAEALARLVPLRPDLAVPIVQASLALMDAVGVPQDGRLPPPEKALAPASCAARFSPLLPLPLLPIA